MRPPKPEKNAPEGVHVDHAGRLSTIQKADAVKSSIDSAAAGAP